MNLERLAHILMCFPSFFMIRKDRKEGKKDGRKLVKYPSLEEWINKL